MYAKKKKRAARWNDTIHPTGRRSPGVDLDLSAGADTFIPDLYDLLLIRAHVAWWEPYNLHDLEGFLGWNYIIQILHNIS